MAALAIKIVVFSDSRQFSIGVPGKDKFKDSDEVE